MSCGVWYSWPENEVTDLFVETAHIFIADEVGLLTGNYRSLFFLSFSFGIHMSFLDVTSLLSLVIDSDCIAANFRILFLWLYRKSRGSKSDDVINGLFPG